MDPLLGRVSIDLFCVYTSENATKVQTRNLATNRKQILNVSVRIKVEQGTRFIAF